MDTPVDDADVQGGLTEREKRENVVRLAFGGDTRGVRDLLPDAAGVRASGHHRHHARQRGDRPSLEGRRALRRRWRRHQRPRRHHGRRRRPGLLRRHRLLRPGVHSRPLSDEDPDIAPDLVPLREQLMAMVGRPVNIQASRDIVTRFRGDLLGQPYVTLFAKAEGLSLKDPPSLPDVPPAHLQHPTRRTRPARRDRRGDRRVRARPGAAAGSHRPRQRRTARRGHRHGGLAHLRHAVARLPQPPAGGALPVGAAAHLPPRVRRSGA